jgi:D-tagatose-1,6-bisphosphate aldolase subunit GatZ/KbaZ
MYLDNLIVAQEQGQAKGIVSICSAHPLVLEAAFHRAFEQAAPVLIESTCNQVNQFGGYTKLTPAEFVRVIQRIAMRAGFPTERLILGGDHLGPEVWQAEPASAAMDKACTLVNDYVAAGYVKIHLDASMKLGDDPPEVPLNPALSAVRAADMAAVAERAHKAFRGGGEAPRYVIGTEVPIPGGARQKGEQPHVSRVSDTRQTIEVTRRAFYERGLHAAWERVIALVVQPGVEFGDDFVFEYDREAAAPLVEFIAEQPGIMYEAHSTDYQTRQALRQLVEDHFAILKVGPALTFALREAVFALALIEGELLQGGGTPLSGILEALESAMLADPRHWERYYRGDPAAQRLARRYSLSDRARYYWTALPVQAALERLFANLSRRPIPLTLISQFLPIQYQHVRQGLIAPNPKALVMDKIGQVLGDYDYACGLS